MAGLPRIDPGCGHGWAAGHPRASAGGFFYGGIFAYVAGSPFAYISYHHVPPQLYGLLFGAGVVGLMAANVINARLVIRFGSELMLVVGPGRWAW